MTTRSRRPQRPIQTMTWLRERERGVAEARAQASALRVPIALDPCAMARPIARPFHGSSSRVAGLARVSAWLCAVYACVCLWQRPHHQQDRGHNYVCRARAVGLYRVHTDANMTDGAPSPPAMCHPLVRLGQTGVPNRGTRRTDRVVQDVYLPCVCKKRALVLAFQRNNVVNEHRTGGLRASRRRPP